MTNETADVMAEIEQMRADYETIKTADRKIIVVWLCWAINWLTNPARLMTDDESDACEELYFELMHELEPHEYREDENGRIWVAC